VPRFTRIIVNYTSTAGESISQELEGFVARVFQHEYDHLDGLVYLDRVESNRDIISEGEFVKLMGSSVST
jgi:N-formylmethionyl-tRNA deformylase